MGELDELMPAFTEMYKQWCRLKGYSLGKAPIEIMVDEATGAEAARMKEFAHWLRLEVFSRIPPTTDTTPLEGVEDESK